MIKKQNLEEKSEALFASLREMNRALVAFSGGVDSTLLAAAAYRTLGEKSAAVTLRSELSTSADRKDSERMVKEIGIKHFYLNVDELSDEKFLLNDPKRCYHCKKLRFQRIFEWAGQNGYDSILDGSNLDDLDDYRPGMDAIRELDVVSSPLLECGFTKSDVRELSKKWGLDTWHKPAGACLASRISPSQPIDRNSLKMIDEAESYLCGILPPDSKVRVRHHGNIARIEADAMSSKILSTWTSSVNSALRTIGYRYVTLDLGGYVMGSCNPPTDT